MSAVVVQQSIMQLPTTLAAVAHELRGPLSALQTTSELLERDFDLLDPQQIRVMVSSMHRRTLWLRDLMENLLLTAVLSDGRLQVHARPVDLRELLTEVESLIEPLLVRKQQKVRVRPRVALPIVSADSRRISQVLINLITNASKYAGSGTLIEVHACARAGQVRVTVADRGPGISPSMVGRLFEPYYRAGRTDGDGLGIGLSVVRTIVEAHGGRVGVKNRRSGGAAFWFELPQIAGLQRPADSETTRLAKVEGGGLG